MFRGVCEVHFDELPLIATRIPFRMGLFIPDDIFKQAGLTERDALIELACRLFDSDRLDFNAAARMAGLSRADLENELRARNLPIIHYTEEDYQQDMGTTKHLDALRRNQER